MQKRTYKEQIIQKFGQKITFRLFCFFFFYVPLQLKNACLTLNLTN